MAKSSNKWLERYIDGGLYIPLEGTSYVVRQQISKPRTYEDGGLGDGDDPKKPKTVIYNDYNKYLKAKQAYNDSLNLYNAGVEKINFGKRFPQASNETLNKIENIINEKYPITPSRGGFGSNMIEATGWEIIGTGPAKRGVPQYTKPKTKPKYKKPEEVKSKDESFMFPGVLSYDKKEMTPFAEEDLNFSDYTETINNLKENESEIKKPNTQIKNNNSSSFKNKIKKLKREFFPGYRLPYQYQSTKFPFFENGGLNDQDPPVESLRSATTYSVTPQNFVPIKRDAKTQNEIELLQKSINERTKNTPEFKQARKLTKEEQDYSDKVKARMKNPSADLGILAANMASAFTRLQYLTPDEIKKITNNPKGTIKVAADILEQGLINELTGGALTALSKAAPQAIESVGKYLTKGPLKNASKLNPRASEPNFTPNPTAANSFNLEELKRLEKLRRVYHNSERFLQPDEINFLRKHGYGNQSQYTNANQNQLPLPPSQINRSGLTKEEMLSKASAKDKDVISKMTENEFSNTVLKPTGEIVPYESEANLIPHFTKNNNISAMSSKEFADRFNQNIHLLKDIVKKRNKSGVEYIPTELDPNGFLRFHTPEQTVSKNFTKKELENIKLFEENPIEYLKNKAGLKKVNDVYVLEDGSSFESVDDVIKHVKDYLEEFKKPKKIFGENSWRVHINPGEWKGNVEDIANTDYFKSIPGLEMTSTTNSVFSDYMPRRGTGTYESINEYLKMLNLGRVKPGFNSQTEFSRSAWENFIKSGKAVGFYHKNRNNPTTVHGIMKSIFPYIGIGGLGAAALQQKENGGWLNKYEQGGYADDSAVLNSEGQEVNTMQFALPTVPTFNFGNGNGNGNGDGDGEDPKNKKKSKDKKTDTRTIGQKRHDALEAAKTKILKTESPENKKKMDMLYSTTMAAENTYGYDPKAYGRKKQTRSPMSIDNIALDELFNPKGEKNRYTLQQKSNFDLLRSLGLPTDKAKLKELLETDDAYAGLGVAKTLYYNEGALKNLPNPTDTAAYINLYLNEYNKKGALKYQKRNELIDNITNKMRAQGKRETKTIKPVVKNKTTK